MKLISNMVQNNFFYQDGTLGNDEKWNNGLKDGIWKMYYPNGKLRKQGFFKDDKKNGLWKTYSSNEVLYMMEIWDNGFLLKTENP